MDPGVRGVQGSRAAAPAPVLFLATTAASTAQPAAAPRCQPAGTLVRIAELPEASGVAISRRSPGRLWAHNDSGKAVLVALDARGAVTGRVQLSGVKIDDWEAIAVGACPGGSCVYVADIGDNNARRRRITVYRVTEPAGESSVSVTDAFHATYPDGAHDAETLLVAPDGGLFIVTKGDTGPIGLYRFPRELKPGGTHQLERVGKPQSTGRIPDDRRITDGAVSADGAWVVLRTAASLAFYRAADFFAGNWTESARVDLKALREPQGEGVALATDGTLYLTGEGGGKNSAGTFVRFACAAASGERP
jgi:glucose/arabinose dehydrogenase